MSLIEIGAFEAKNRWSDLLDLVEKGEEITITRHGRPVARLVPSDRGIDRSQVQAALKRIRDRAAQSRRGDFDWAVLKTDRDASRP